MSLQTIAETVSTKSIIHYQNAKDWIDNKADKYFLKPAGAGTISKFVFSYEGDTTLNAQADITEHYMEDLKFVQDHIAIKPIKITLRGFVGELVDAPPIGFLGTVTGLQDKLSVVPAYLGKYTPSQLKTIQKGLTKVINITNQVKQTMAKVKKVAGSVANFFGFASPVKTKQQQAYSDLITYMNARMPVTVSTPYNFFPLMAIESIVMIQDETTKDWTDISVTLKELRFSPVNSEKNKKLAKKNTSRNAVGLSDKIKQKISKSKTLSFAERGIKLGLESFITSR